MKLYSFLEPQRLDPQITVEIVFTKEDVLKFYWQHWKEKMESMGFDNSVTTEENCVEDFVIVNWATVCDDTELEPTGYSVVRMDYDMWLEYQQRMKEHE